MKNKLIKKYADLIATIGINAEKNRNIKISAPVECAPFVRLLAAALYKKKALDVTVTYNDIELRKINLKNCSTKQLAVVPDWLENREQYLVENKYFAITIIGDDPDALKKTDPNKLKISTRALVERLHKYKKPYHNNELAWTIAACPTAGWAKKVFPGESASRAKDKLWQAIFDATRVSEDNDPVSDWEKHIASIESRSEKLTKLNFKSLHYKASNGTDFIVPLAANHIWCGAASVSPDGHRFTPNIPTEETFTMPAKYGINGHVVASKPLSRSGVLIEDFSFDFKDGAVVDFSARVGYEALKQIVEFDATSKYLGEVALVPYHSPISLSNIIFYETLFDENASCHLALGASFTENIVGGLEMNEEQLEKAGANDSKMHCDFMIGTKDLSIIGTTYDGKEIAVFTNGDWSL